ncbi:MAG: hypothetical protein ACPKQO_00165 [Nitrososphaeraceae archaeon]
MNTSNAKEFLKYIERSSSDSNVDIIKLFISWCNKKNLEELLFRLTSDEFAGLKKNYSIDFTNKRILISKKSSLKKLLDIGFVGGMSPCIHFFTSNKTSKIKNNIFIDIEKILNNKNLDYCLYYYDIEKITISRGNDSRVNNMVGSFITKNYLAISMASGDKYDFSLPVRKNGNFEKISYWLKVLLPTRVSIIN